MTSFTDLTFLFRFLPIFLLIYYLVKPKYKDYVMLVASIFFYAVGAKIFVLLLMALTGFNYFYVAYSYRHDLSKKSSMVIPVVIDVIVLFAFKGMSVFVDNALLPLGLSFYIFKMISLQADVYRRRIPENPGFFAVATYFTMFPQISEGPIMRFETGNFKSERHVVIRKVEQGLKYFIIGFAMKTILADRIGILWNDIQMYGYESISTPLAWLGAFAYTFELYFDFWGYSLMAEGLLVAMGYDFVRNFDEPYSSKTISEFYRRWHMTLGSFFRDYVYFPMGGSRCSKAKMCFNLMVVWALTGIWHGNGINFLIWGLVLGVFIVLEKLFYGKTFTKIPVVGNIYVIFIIPLTWVIFAITDLNKLLVYFTRLFPFFGTKSSVINNSDIFMYLQDYWWMFLVAILLCIPKITGFLKNHLRNWYMNVILFALFWISIYFSASSAGNPFMYLNF